MSTMMQPLHVPATLKVIPHSDSAEDSVSERRQQKMPVVSNRGTAGRMPQEQWRARQKKVWPQTLTSRRHQAPSKSVTYSSSKSKSSSMLLSYGRLILIGMAIGIAAVAGTRLLKHIRERTPAVAELRDQLRASPRPVPAQAEPSDAIFPAPSGEVEGQRVLRLTRWSLAPGQDETVEHILGALGGTRAVFHGRSSRGPGFTPPFEADTREVFACVDAGNGELWIGGGGVNGEIGAQLLRAARRHQIRTSSSQIASATAEIHTEALRIAKQQRGTLVRLDRHEQLGASPFRRVFAYVPRGQPTWNEGATGSNVASVFIDVLDRQYTPHGNPQNAYVVYAVPPKGSAPDADFKAAYEETYKSIVTAVSMFNRSAGRDRQIQRLRIPLLSAGIFAGGRSPRDLGSQAMQALSSAIRQEGRGPVLDFAWESTEAFFGAAQDLELRRP